MLRYIVLGLLVFFTQHFSIFQLEHVERYQKDLEIDIWYGDNQHFGHLGQPQRWINILGNVSGLSSLKTLEYRLNDQAPEPLSVGSDLHRLALEGDFNVELSWEEVNEGTNVLSILANTPDGRLISKSIRFSVQKNKKWPLPFAVDFSEVNQLQDVVQIVDGHWLLVDDGVRTKQRYYDRVLTMGDTSWINYESLVLLTIHDWTASQPGPPTYNVSHFGVAMRWRGHHTDGRQPSRKWFPLGAQGEFLLKENTDSCQWRILFDGRTKEKPQVYAQKRSTFKIGEKIYIKTQVMTTPDGRTRYRFKQWAETKKEPKFWDVEGFEANDYASGALCLVPHNSDVTIHTVQVIPFQEF